ncbi:MAG: MFS transporter [Actinomycetota bacterium]|nr:MFS transporter [Actinomycetota bacterium]
MSITATTATTLPVFLTGALAVQVRESLHFSVGALGLLVAAFFASASLVSVLAGAMAEKLGGERIMRACALAVAFLLFGIAVFGHSYAVLLVLLVLAGFTNGAMQPAVNLFVIDAVPPGRRGFALGVKQAAIPVSTLFAGLAVPAIALTIGWQYAYAIAGVVALIVLAAVPPGRSTGITRSGGDSKARPRIALPPIITLAAAMALGAGAANALGAFLVENAVHTGFSPSDAGLLAAFGSACGLISRLVGGALADRRGGRHLPVIAGMVGLGAVGYAAFALQNYWLVIPATAIAYAAGWGWNGVFNFAIVVNHPGAEGRATGTTQAGAYIGSVIGPLAFGYAVDHLSFQWAWALASVTAVVAAAGMLVGRRLLLRERDRGATAITVVG